MSAFIATPTDLDTWLASARPNWVETGILDSVREALLAADHPPYGADWSAWLADIGAEVIDEELSAWAENAEVAR